jgi:hypothetical protein
MVNCSTGEFILIFYNNYLKYPIFNPFPVTTLQRLSIPAAPPRRKKIIKNQGIVPNH